MLQRKRHLFRGQTATFTKPSDKIITGLTVSRVAFASNSAELRENDYEYTDNGDSITITVHVTGHYVVQYHLDDDPDVVDTVVAGDTTITQTFLGGGGGGSSGAEYLDDLLDCTIGTPTPGDGLIYTSGVWRNAAVPAAASLNDIGDVSITSPGVGSTILWDGVKWIDGTIGGTHTFMSHSDTVADTFNYGHVPVLRDTGIGGYEWSNMKIRLKSSGGILVNGASGGDFAWEDLTTDQLSATVTANYGGSGGNWGTAGSLARSDHDHNYDNYNQWTVSDDNGNFEAVNSTNTVKFMPHVADVNLAVTYDVGSNEVRFLWNNTQGFITGTGPHDFFGPPTHQDSSWNHTPAASLIAVNTHGPDPDWQSGYLTIKYATNSGLAGSGDFVWNATTKDLESPEMSVNFAQSESTGSGSTVAYANHTHPTSAAPSGNYTEWDQNETITKKWIFKPEGVTGWAVTAQDFTSGSYQSGFYYLNDHFQFYGRNSAGANRFLLNSNGDSYFMQQLAIGQTVANYSLDVIGEIRSQDYTAETTGGSYRVVIGGSTDGYIQIRNNSAATKLFLRSNGNSYNLNYFGFGDSASAPYRAIHSRGAVNGLYVGALLENAQGSGSYQTSVSLDFNHNGTGAAGTNASTGRIMVAEYDPADYRTNMRFYIQNTNATNTAMLEGMRLQNTGTLQVQGDVIAYSTAI